MVWKTARYGKIFEDGKIILKSDTEENYTDLNFDVLIPNTNIIGAVYVWRGYMISAVFKNESNRDQTEWNRICVKPTWSRRWVVSASRATNAANVSDLLLKLVIFWVETDF